MSLEIGILAGASVPMALYEEQQYFFYPCTNIQNRMLPFQPLYDMLVMHVGKTKCRSWILRVVAWPIVPDLIVNIIHAFFFHLAILVDPEQKSCSKFTCSYSCIHLGFYSLLAVGVSGSLL